jgi:hypothetical protein
LHTPLTRASPAATLPEVSPNELAVGGGEGVVNVRPLAPGRCGFFDDFHRKTRGVLAVQ